MVNIEEWQRARDARVAETERRMARGVFGQMQLQIMSELKAPLLEAITTLASPDTSKIEKIKAANKLWGLVKDIEKLPEPTFENTWHPNSHRLIEIRDEFFERCGLGWPRQKFIRAVFNFVIMIYDYDRPYRDLIDWAKEEVDKSGWEPRGAMDLIAADWSGFWKE